MLRFWVSAGANYNSSTGSLGIQNNTFDFWGVQGEEGYSASAFKQKSLAEELRACQRYYYYCALGGYLFHDYNSGNACCSFLTFPSPMRLSPTITVRDGVGNINKITFSSDGANLADNITPPSAKLITNAGWNFNAGGMGAATSRGIGWFAYIADAEY